MIPTEVLKVQPVVDPRSYKISESLRACRSIAVRQVAYSHDRGGYAFRAYRGDCTPMFGVSAPQLPQLGTAYRICEQTSLMMNPMKRIIGGRLRMLAKRLGASVIHTNGAPDALGELSKTHTDLPVIHEIYDTYSLYDNQDLVNPIERLQGNLFSTEFRKKYHKMNLIWEEFVHKRCDALVFTSEEMRNSSAEMYGDFRSIVVPNGILKAYVPLRRKERLSNVDGYFHCVYLGAVHEGLRHRNILEQIRQVASSKGVILHVYPTASNAHTMHILNSIASDTGAVRIHKPLHYKDLYSEISQYDLGLVLLGPGNERLLDVALPNKVFEYVGAGLSVAVPPFESLMGFVSKYGCGFTVDDWASLVEEHGGDIRQVPFNEEFTIDYYVPRLTSLYDSLS